MYKYLEKVQKPYQYIGQEHNITTKDLGAAEYKFCLAFPDAYEVGISNIGLQILYKILNDLDGVVCDRAYTPLRDMGDMLKQTQQLLLSKENYAPLNTFDCIGFTLQYELGYTNVLYMLDLASIPLRSHLRTNNDPLIIAGGPCALNPEPMAEFIDAFVIGEGEEVLVEVAALLKKAKHHKQDRSLTLQKLAQIDGVYVPGLYEPNYNKDGSFDKLKQLTKIAPKLVTRRVIKDLDTAPIPTKPITPAIRPVHDRISIEIQRGCTRSCRFCQAGYIYRPRRERSNQIIAQAVEESIENTATHDIGLLSLSSADYKELHSLMTEILKKNNKDNLAVSLPSTRLEALRPEYLDLLKEERRNGFTIAPEAGSQRLRNVINKNFTEQEIIDTAKLIFENGWSQVKMYFMIGHPTETDEDVIAIGKLANAVYEQCSSIKGKKLITVSVSNFVPKPHTPFQWHMQIDENEIRRKQKLIRSSIRYHRNIKFKGHNPDQSYAEGLLSRGDRRCAEIIENVYKKGANFDSWSDLYDIEIWKNAISEYAETNQVNLHLLGTNERPYENRLPWHRIHSGIHPKFFKNEMTKAIYGIATEDCSFSACHECGLCNEKNGLEPIVKPTALAEQTQNTSPIPENEVTQIYRFQFTKMHEARFISNLDLQKLMVRNFTLAGLRVAFDNGLTSRPKINLASALSIGIESKCELMDIELKTDHLNQSHLEKINQKLPNGVKLLTFTKVQNHDLPLHKLVQASSFQLSSKNITSSPKLYEELIEKAKSQDKLIVLNRRKTKSGDWKHSEIDIKQNLCGIQLADGDVIFSLKCDNGQNINPSLITKALEALGSESLNEFKILKIGNELMN